MTDIFGPGANTTNVTTTRPADSRVFNDADTWFKNCTSAANNDGTRMPAEFLNAIIANFRTVSRKSGLADSNSDEQLWKAMARMVQAPVVRHAADTGAANAYVATYSPAPLKLEDGLRLSFWATNANTGASTLTANGLGAAIVMADGGLLGGGEIQRNAIVEVTYNATLGAWQLINPAAFSSVTSNTLVRRGAVGELNAAYIYNPSTKMTVHKTGDIWGTAWGSALLSEYLAATYLKLKDASAYLKATDASSFLKTTDADWALTGSKIPWRGAAGDLNASYIYNPETKMCLYASGDLWGTAWGSTLLSNYLTNNFATLSAMSASLAPNGYQKLPSGLIIQWGTTGSFTAEGSLSVTLPVAFPSACFVALASVNGYASDCDLFAQVTAKSTTSLTIYIQRAASGNGVWPVTASFLAIGY